MKLSRRHVLAAGLGLSALSRAQATSFPKRVVFYVQPHGHVPKGWNLPFPGVANDRPLQASLGALKQTDFPEVLRPLHAHRQQLLVLEGLSHMTQLFDIAEVARTSGDLNNHQVAVADLLTGARAAQTPGLRCTGGARSIDQELGLRLAAPGRFGSRVYGADYVPNQTVSPFSYLAARQATPVVASPQQAFQDLMALTMPSVTDARKTKLAAMRGSVLEMVQGEYTELSARLDAEGRAKLDEHRQLLHDLQLRVEAPTPMCTASFDARGDTVTQFMRVIRLALACDLTRVLTYIAPVPRPTDFGYPATSDVHGGFAHASIQGATSCGAIYTPLAERAMIDLGAWYAQHLGVLLDELAAVPEGNGTLLDNTVVVWVSELATGTHEHHDTFTVLAGGCGGAFETGRYLRYGRTLANPHPTMGPRAIGPSQNRLFVSLLRALGQSDDTFGLGEVLTDDGTHVSMRGPLDGLSLR